MRSLFHAAVAALFLAVLAGCARERPGGLTHPNLIAVREFAFSTGVVALDPSFGFSLYRGSPGVPPRQRAEAVGRAAGFSLADAVAQQLQSLGYDAVRSDTIAAEPGGRALIVAGTFRRINEGHRRQNASLAVDIEVDYQASGAAPQRLTAFSFDSRGAPREPLTAAAARQGTSVNSAAVRVGGVIARYVADLARANNWPSAPH